MINTSIEHNLRAYVRKIDDEGVFNKQDEKLNAEDLPSFRSSAAECPREALLPLLKTL